MSVTFSGLASGIDTASIVESLIELESAPITAAEDKIEYLETKLESHTELNTLLEEFSAAVMSLNDKNDLARFTVNNNGSDFFSISTTSIADEGSYSVEVIGLAQQQKDISPEGFSDIEETMLTGELQIGSETLSYDNVTLSGLVSLIEEGDYGVSATIVNVGTDNGYRLILTAANAGEEIDITGTGSITLDTATDGHTVEGTKAHAIIDGVDYYSDTNTISSAIHGATITLSGESDSGADLVSLTSGAEDVITTQLEEIVSVYNEIKNYIDTISATDPTLARSMKTVQSGIKNYLSSNAMVNLGIEMDWTSGELSFDGDMFSEAYEEDSDAVIQTLFGSDDSTGVMTRLDDYLEEELDSTTGFLARKTSSTEEQISRLDDSITAMQTRLDKRQAMLEAQFTAMETLISSLNSQGDYLTSFFEDYNSSS
jgi:flagellar hook-associated protein 2